MDLNLVIIHLDMVVDTLHLEPGDYSLGRSSKNNIVVQHFSLYPEHGRIFFEEDQWFYESFDKKRTIAINNWESIELSDQMSLATQDHVESGKTKLTEFSILRGAHRAKLNKRLAVAGGVVAALLLATMVGYQKYRGTGKTVTETTLLNRVRSKIVEFEVSKDQESIDALKKYAGLTDADFKETSGFCTGFLVGPNIVLTAGHCLLGRLVIDINNDFYLKTSDGKQHQIKEVLGFDVKRDFLFLRTEDMESYGHLNFADDYEIQQKVYTVGNVHGEGIAIRDGIISSETSDPDDPEVKFLRYSAGTSPGNSGGPLLDEKGDVVALVFAATGTENFNLGTSSRDLIEAYDKYVEGSDQKQTIKLAMKRVLNFKPAFMLQALSLPYLPQFDEYPEISQKFNEIAIDVEVPIEFSKVVETILSPLNKEVIETFYEVQEILKKNKEVVLDWKSFVSNKTPAILPSQFDASQSVFVKKNNRYYPLLSGLIDSPSKADVTKYNEQLDKEGIFDFQAYGYNIEIADKKFDLLDSDVLYKPKDATGNKQRLQNLAYGPPYSELLIKGENDLRTAGFFGMKLFMKNFVGDTGFITNAFSRFIRPQSMKDFTVANLEISNEDIQSAEVKDRFNRVWKRSRIKIFESINIITYCIELPEGTMCVGRVFNLYNNYLLTIIENNFRKFILSHLLLNPYFWEKKALISFIEKGDAKNIPSMNGVSLNQKDGKLTGSLSHFGFNFEVPNPEKVESIRLQTGIYGNDEKSDWTGFGIDWIQREKDKTFACGLGVEAFDSNSTFILNFLRDRRKQEKSKKFKGEKAQALPGVWYRPIRGGKFPLQAYGYCAPMEQDPRIKGHSFVDFKNSKPLKYNYTP